MHLPPVNLPSSFWLRGVITYMVPVCNDLGVPHPGLIGSWERHAVESFDFQIDQQGRDYRGHLRVVVEHAAIHKVPYIDHLLPDRAIFETILDLLHGCNNLPFLRRYSPQLSGLLGVFLLGRGISFAIPPGPKMRGRRPAGSR